VLTRSLLFSQIFTRAFCFSPELPHRPAWCFPALLAIFLAPVVISAQGAPVILFSAAQCFGRSALLVRRRVLQFSLRSFGFRVQPSLLLLGGRWRFLAARPPSCSSFGVRFLLSPLGREPVPSAGHSRLAS
jgi:hypothetical protein